MEIKASIQPDLTELLNNNLIKDEELIKRLKQLDTTQLINFLDVPNERVKKFAKNLLIENLSTNIKKVTSNSAMEKTHAILLNRFFDNYDFSKDKGKGIILLAKFGFLENLKRLHDKAIPEEALNEAAGSGQIEVVRFLLKSLDKSTEINPAFQSACEKGQIEVVKLLLDDERVNPSADDNAAVSYASENGHYDVVELLLKINGVNPGDNNNYSIKYASGKGHKKVVELLLKQPSVNPSNSESMALRNAVEGGHHEVVELLLKDGRANPSAGNNQAIIHSCTVGNKKITELLLKDSRVDASAKNNEAIRKASANGHTGIVELLVNVPNVDPSDNKNEALKAAVNKKHISVVELLLKNNKVDPSINDNSAIKMASDEGLTDTVKSLLNNPKVNPSAENNKAIQNASQKGHIEVVRLLRADKRVDPSDNDNEAIIAASENGHDKIVELLLDDTRVNPSDDNNVAIQRASQNGKDKVVKILLRNDKVNPAANDNFALQQACQKGHINVVNLLLETNKVSDTQYKALINALDNNHLEVARKLVEYSKDDPTAKFIYSIYTDPAINPQSVSEALKRNELDLTANNYLLTRLLFLQNKTSVIQHLLETNYIQRNPTIDPVIQQALRKGNKDLLNVFIKHKDFLDLFGSKILVNHLQDLVEIYKEKKEILKPILIKLAQDEPVKYAQNYEVLNSIIELFPVNEENAELYPLAMKVLNSNLSIKTISQLLISLPDLVLKKMSEMPKYTTMLIYFLESPGVDQGGLTRQFLTQLMSGILNKNLETLRFNKYKNGLSLPEVNSDKPDELHKELKYLETIGRIFAICISSKNQYVVGQIFVPGLFTHLCLLDDSEVAKSSTDFIKELTPERMRQIYTPLLDLPEQEAFNHLNHLSVAKTIEDAKNAISYFSDTFIIEKEDDKTLVDYQKEVLNALRDNWISKLMPCHAIAKGIKEYIPWINIRESSPAQLDKLVQGTLNKEMIKKMIKVVFAEKGEINPKFSERLKNWIDEWIDKQPDDMMKLKNFLQALTGAPAVTSEISFILKNNESGLKGIYLHTCTFKADVPIGIVDDDMSESTLEEKKETVFTQFDQWASGQDTSVFTQE